MNKTFFLLLIGIAAISLMSGCVLDYSEIYIFNDHLEACHQNYIIYEPYVDENCLSFCTGQTGGTNIPFETNGASPLSLMDCQDICQTALPKQVSLPFSFSVPRCNPGDANEIFSNPAYCMDYRGCSPGQDICLPATSGCSGYPLPSNYKCQVIEQEESYNLCISYQGTGTIYVNGIPFQGVTSGTDGLCMTFVNNWEGEGQVPPNFIVGIPSSITITTDAGGPTEIGVIFKGFCCYECREKSIPAAILYPKVDIENFQIIGGNTIIQDGKIVSSFNIVPGTQQTKIQIENRGFFTQNEVRVRVEGLPEGISVDITPSLQKIKAHNIGTFDATFTVDPNVPSGKYQVLMVAFSSKGIYDRIIVDIVVP